MNRHFERKECFFGDELKSSREFLTEAKTSVFDIERRL